MIASVSSLKGSSRLSQHSRIVSGHDFPEQSPHLRSRGFTSPVRRICGVVCKTRSAPKRLRGVWSLWRPTIRGRHLHWPVADSRAPGVLALHDAASATHTSGFIHCRRNHRGWRDGGGDRRNNRRHHVGTRRVGAAVDSTHRIQRDVRRSDSVDEEAQQNRTSRASRRAVCR